MKTLSKKTTSRSTTETAEAPLIANDMAIEIVDVSGLRDPARTVKPPSKRGIATAKAILEQWNQPIPIAVNEDGTVIAGLEFLVAARELGWKTIKVVRVSNLSHEHVRVLTIALARLPELSKWDNDALRLEFTDLLSIDLGFDLHDISGFAIGEMDVVLEGNDAGDNESDLLDDIPDATVASSEVSMRGDLWLLGSHRLLCGNALEAEDYARLFSGKRARLCLVDLPFNIPVANNVSGLGKVKHQDFAMAVGEMSFAQFSHFLKTFLMLTCAHLIDGALVYVFMDRRKLEELFLAAREAGLSIVDLCIWSKAAEAWVPFIARLLNRV